MSRLGPKNNPYKVLLLGAVFLFAPLAHGAQEAVYKDRRPMKKLFESQQTSGAGETSKEHTEGAHFTYDPTGKTDPFKPFLVEQEPAEEKQKQVVRPRTYLETLDLSQLELIAIVVGPRGNFAMLRDSKGTGHVIRKGTPVGMNNGQVYSITEKEVTIREEFKDFRGSIQHKDIAKRLPSLQPQQ